MAGSLRDPLPRLPWRAAAALVLLAALSACELSRRAGPCSHGAGEDYWRAAIGYGTGYTAFSTGAPPEGGRYLYQFSSCTGGEVLWADEDEVRRALPRVPALLSELREMLGNPLVADARTAGLARMEQAAGEPLPPGALLGALHAARKAAWLERAAPDDPGAQEARADWDEMEALWRARYEVSRRAPLLDAALAAAAALLLLAPWCRAAARWQAGAALGLAAWGLVGAGSLQGASLWDRDAFLLAPAPGHVQLLRWLGPGHLLAAGALVAGALPWRAALRRPRSPRPAVELALAAAVAAPFALAWAWVAARLDLELLSALQDRLLVSVGVAAWGTGATLLLVSAWLVRAWSAPAAPPDPDAAGGPA